MPFSRPILSGIGFQPLYAPQLFWTPVSLEAVSLSERPDGLDPSDVKVRG